MKKIMACIVCALVFVGAMVANAADYKQISAMERSEAVRTFQSMTPSEWAVVIQAAINEGSNAEAKKVLVYAEEAINGLTKEAADSIMEAINENVSSFSFVRSFDGYVVGKFVTVGDSSAKFFVDMVKLNQTISGAAFRN